MNLTLSVDEKIVRKARKAAASMGMSLNEAVRRFLLELGGGDSVDQDIVEMRDLSLRSGGDSRGQPIDREGLHERP